MNLFKSIFQSSRFVNHRLTLKKRFLQYPFLLASLSVTGMLLTLRQVGGLDSWEVGMYDYLTRRQHYSGQEARILVVEITEEDIREQNQAIMSDRTIAQTIKSLQVHGPTVIGLDIFRDIPEPPGHDLLKQELGASNVIVINELGDLSTSMIPAPDYVDQERVGFNDFVLDTDDILRRYLIYASLGQESFYSFSLRLSLKYLEKHQPQDEFVVRPQYLKIGATVFPRLNSEAGGYHLIDASGYQSMIRYQLHDRIMRKISLTEVLNGDVDPEWVTDKVVLIGTTARTSKDYFSTPYSANLYGSPTEHKLAGVLVHAQLTHQILSAVLDQSS